MSIYETSVKKPITTALIYVAIAILGLFALTRLAIELMPNTDTTTVMIITAYPGASAEDIESNVTKVLENSLNGIDKLKHISSKSQENSSIITMQFRAGTPIAEATNDIRDKLDATSELLPTGAKKPTIFKFDNASIPVAAAHRRRRLGKRPRRHQARHPGLLRPLQARGLPPDDPADRTDHRGGEHQYPRRADRPRIPYE